MINILDLVLDNTSRQRYAIIRLFIDHPNSKFSRQEVLKWMEENPYNDILCKGGDNPFHNVARTEAVPTILRDRLDELVKEKVLGKEKSGNKIVYHLKENLFRDILENHEISDKKALELRSLIPSWKKYRELPIAFLLSTLDKKSRAVFESSSDEGETATIVDFETPFVGNNNITELVTSLYLDIHDRTTIKEIVYSGNYYSGKSPAQKTLLDFMPYVLKESRGQWFLTGKCKDYDDFISIPVNRIISKVDYENEVEFKREPFSPQEYWDGCAGVTRYGSPVNMEFLLKNGSIYNNIDYITITPIVRGNHQKTYNEGKWLRVVLEKVYFGPEIVRIIRSFGKDNIKDVSPAWLEEDLWEPGRREDIFFSIKFPSVCKPEAWTQHAAERLQIYAGGLNANAVVAVRKSPNKQGWYQFRIENVLVNSRLYFFMTETLKEFSSKRVHIKDRSFLK